MICVRNYRPSVISIGRRLTNSALALATFSPIASLQDLKTLQFLTSINVLWKKIYNILALAIFSPIASLQHLEKLEFIGRKYTTSRFPFFTYSDDGWRQNFFGSEMSSGWRFHNFSSYLSLVSSPCNFLATLFVRRSQDSPSRVYCLLVELKSTFIWEWKCGYNGPYEKVQLMAIGQWWERLMWKSVRWRNNSKVDPQMR